MRRSAVLPIIGKNAGRSSGSDGKLNAKELIEGDIGSGALVYKGAQGNNPQVSIWEVTLYGTLKMATEDNKDFTSKFGVTKTVQECAEKKNEAQDHHPSDLMMTTNPTWISNGEKYARCRCRSASTRPSSKDTRRRRRIALIVVGYQLDRTSEQPGFRIYVLLPDLLGKECGFAIRGQPPGHCHTVADLDRLIGLCRRCRHNQKRARNNG